ncbi:putative ferric-chelate reductase 1, partial [Clarias magur]
MESRLMAVVVFVCAVYQSTEAQLFPVTALSTSITNTTCGTSKLCVSSVSGCDPAGNSSCFFSSTQGSTVFVCGNNNTNAFFETAIQYNNKLCPVPWTTVNITSVQGSVTGNQSLNQSRTQCAFNIDLKSTFLNSVLSKFNFSTLLNSTLLNFTPFNSTIRNIFSSTLLNSSPFNSTLIPLLNSTLINTTEENYTLLSLVPSYYLNSSEVDSPIISLLRYYDFDPSILNWSLPTAIDNIISNSLVYYLNINLFNSTFNSTTINSAARSSFVTFLNSTHQNSTISNYTVRDLLNSTLLSVPAQLPFNITILTGATNETQLGNASTVFTSAGPLDLANPVPLNITRNGCKSTKLCLSEAQDCDPAGTGSCFFSSVRLTDQTFFFELSGTTSGYVALALTKN